MTAQSTVETALSEPSERFASRKEAWDWLVSQGGTVSRGKFYEDAKRGQYRVYADKSVSRASVAEYLLKQHAASPRADLDLVDYDQNRKRLEVEKLQLEVDKLTIATRSADREWMRTDDHWAHLAASLALLKGNLEHFTRLTASALIVQAGGDYSQAPQLADAIIAQVIGPAYNELTIQKIESGVFADEGIDQEDAPSERE